MKVGFSKISLEEALKPKQPIREPIEAVIAYFEEKNLSSIWITLDLMDLNRGFTDGVKEAVFRNTGVGIDKIHVCSTHNHGGGNPSKDTVAKLVSQAALDAMKNSREAKMRSAAARSEKQLNIIRRLYIPELCGSSTLYFGASEDNGLSTRAFSDRVINDLREGKECNYIGEVTEESEEAFPPADREIAAIEFITDRGDAIGRIIRFAAHAVCANRPGSYSSDYPYYVRQRSEMTGGGITMFLNGPCAEIAPVMRDKLEGRERSLGEYIADLAMASLANSKPEKILFFDDRKKEIKLPVRKEVLEMKVEIPSEMPEPLPERKRYLERLRLQKTLPFLNEKYSVGESTLTDEVSVFIGLLRFNGTAFVAFPGETFFATGEAVKRELNASNLITVTEHERTVMYLPPREEEELGGYEAVCKLTSPEAEELLREGTVKFLKEFLSCR